MNSFTAFGRIYEMKPTDRGYTRLSIASNIPFKMKLYKFNVWDRTLLKTELMEPFQVGNEVKVTYKYKNKFPTLMEMVLTSLDTCPVCFSHQEAMDAQRQDCPGCSLIPEAAHKTRVNVLMKVKSCTPKEYEHSVGHLLYLDHEEEKKTYYTVIFPSSPLFNLAKDIKVDKNYYIVGWKTAHSKMLELVDIYQS